MSKIPLIQTSFHSVYKRQGVKDTTYVIRYRLDGKSIDKAVGKLSDGMTAAKAYDVLTKHRHFDKRSYETIKNPSLSQLSTKYFQLMKDLTDKEDGFKLEDRKAKTIANIKREESIYRNMWQSWIFSTQPLVKIKEEYLVKHLTELKVKHGYSHKSITNALALGKSILKHTKFTECNPFIFEDMENKDRFKKKINARQRYLSPAELKELLLKAEMEVSPQSLLLMKVAVFTGARPDSILNIQVKDINFRTQKIKIWDFKRKMYYFAPLSEQMAEDFKKHIRKNYQYLFYTRRTKGQTKINQFPREIGKLMNKMFNEHVYESNEKVVPYTLRHTFANILIQVKKLPVLEVSHLLNHASIETTIKNYLSLDTNNIDSDFSELLV